MKNRIFTLLLAVVASLCTAFAERVLVDGLYYNINPYNQVAKVTYLSNSENYPSLTSVVVPSTITYDSVVYNVTTLDDMCFYNCSNLSSVTIPGSVTEIGFMAFHSCASLTTITIPASVTSIGMVAFAGCDNLESFIVEEGNTVYAVPQGSNAIIETATHTLIAGCKTTVIPDDVTTIGYGAFQMNYNLTSITIPASVTSIGAGAFSSCFYLTSITCLATTPPALGNNCFNGVPANCTVIVPESALESYMQAEGWDYFESLQPKQEEGPDPECTGEPQASGTCGEHLTYEIDCNNVFWMRGYGMMDDYDTAHIAFNPVAPWKAFRNVVKRIEFPERLKSVGQYAFTAFVNITSLVLPDSVETLNYGAFGVCSKLESVQLPSRLKTLDGAMFFSDEALKSLTIPASVDSIGHGITHGCRALTSLVVEQGNQRYDSRNNCNAVIETASNRLIAGSKNTVIPAGVTGIDMWAFSNSDISSITLPEGLRYLGRWSFESCRNLHSINIPSTVDSINCEAFNGNSLKSITVDPANPVYDSRDSCNAIIHTASNVLVIGCQNSVIPEGIVELGPWSFEDEYGLKSLTIPSTVTNIGVGAFYGCQYLEKLVCYAPVPPSVVMENPDVSLDPYPYSTFYHIPTGIPVYVPAESIELYRADNGWKRFTNFKAIGEEEEEYELDACVKESGDCGALVHWAVTCGEDSLIIYGSGAMAQYNNVTTPWDAYRTKIRTIDIREGVTSVGKSAFKSFWNVQKVNLPEGLVSIGSNAFFFCTALKSVSLPNSLRTMEMAAFSYCTGLTSFTLPVAVDTIDGSALTGCHNLLSITVKPGNTKYDSRDNCNAIIETASNTLYRGCKNTVIPEDVTVIGYYAFMSSDSLRTMTLPASITLIDGFAFYGCKNLHSLTSLATTPPTIRYADYTFQDVPTTLTVYVPAAALTAYQTADIWKSFNIVPLTGNHVVKALATHGVVLGTGVYADGTHVELTAVPDAGFEFVQWSDGTTANPKDLIVTKDTTIRALFQTPEPPMTLVAEPLETNLELIVISWDPVTEALQYELHVYKDGVLTAAYIIDNDNNIIGEQSLVPSRLKARKLGDGDMLDDSTDKLRVEISGLERGVSYTYSLDAYNTAYDCVAAFVGTFITPYNDTPTGVDEATSNELTRPCKRLENGTLVIILPDGRRYSADGALIMR